MSADAEARLAIDLAELAGRRALAAWRMTDDPVARELVRDAHRRLLREAPRVAWFALRNRADREVILQAPVPPRYAAMPRGTALFRDYAAAVSDELRRQQLNFDRYATMTNLLAHVAAQRPAQPRQRALQLGDYADDGDGGDPGRLVSGYTPEFDPGSVLPIHIDVYDAAATTVLQRIGVVGYDFHLEDPTILREIQALQLDRIRGIDATTIKGLRQVLVRNAGGTVVDIAKAIRDYWDQASTRRALVIAHTEMAYASAAAERDTYRRNGIDQVEFSGNASLDDGNDATNCNNYLGMIVAADSAEAGNLIPLHPLCVLPGTRILSFGAFVAAFRAQYDGPAVRVHTARTTVATTAQHPVLTRRGWLPAKDLRQGDHVLSVSPADDASAVFSDLDHMPSMAEEVFDALSVAGTATREVCPTVGLHGAGQFIEGHVDVVRASSSLNSEGHPDLEQVHSQLDLVRASRIRLAQLLARLRPGNHDRAIPSGQGSRDIRRMPLPCHMRVGGQGQALVVGHPGGAAQTGIPSADGKPLGAQHHAHGPLRDTEAGCDRVLTGAVYRGGTDASPVDLGAAGGAALRWTWWPDLVSSGDDRCAEELAVHAGFTSNSGQWLACDVSADEVVKIDTGWYRGHVYDFQCGGGAYFANGVASLNCTHYWSPVFPPGWSVPAMPWAGGALDEGGGPSVESVLSGEYGRAARQNHRHVRVGIRRLARVELRERRATAAHSGVMVAFMMPLVARAMLALPGGEASEDLHVTLAFLGHTDTLGDPGPLRRAVAAFAGEAPPMAATVTGVGRLTAVDTGEPHPVVALIDCPGLESFRQGLLVRLREAGFEADGTHGFLPHATLAYIDPAAPTPVETLPPLKLRFVDITLAVGPNRYTWRLAGGA